MWTGHTLTFYPDCHPVSHRAPHPLAGRERLWHAASALESGTRPIFIRTYWILPMPILQKVLDNIKGCNLEGSFLNTFKGLLETKLLEDIAKRPYETCFPPSGSGSGSLCDSTRPRDGTRGSPGAAGRGASRREDAGRGGRRRKAAGRGGRRRPRRQAESQSRRPRRKATGRGCRLARSHRPRDATRPTVPQRKILKGGFGHEITRKVALLST